MWIGQGTSWELSTTLVHFAPAIDLLAEIKGPPYPYIILYHSRATRICYNYLQLSHLHCQKIEAVLVRAWFGHATQDTNIIYHYIPMPIGFGASSKLSLCAMLWLLCNLISNYRWNRLCHGVSSSLMWLSTTWCDFSVSPLCHRDGVTFPAWWNPSTVLVCTYYTYI